MEDRKNRTKNIVIAAIFITILVATCWYIYKANRSSNAVTPEPTETIVCSGTAVPTDVLKITNTPIVTDIASPTDTLVPTNTLISTCTPVLTDIPLATDTPLPTALLTVTDTPIPTGTPIPTNTPSVIPDVTQMPTDTVAPTSGPVCTNTPTSTPIIIEELVTAVQPKTVAYEENAKYKELDVENTDVFYLNLSDFSSWESGEYNDADGTKKDNKRRLRYPDYLKSQGKLCITLTDGYNLKINEYSQDYTFRDSIVINGGSVYTPSSGTAYFSITLFRAELEKELSLGQWNKLFSDGMEIVIYSQYEKPTSLYAAETLIGYEAFSCSNILLTNELLCNDDAELAENIWRLQIASGIYELQGNELNNGNTTYFVSSSEGSDENSGLNMYEPKKTLDSFSGMSNVNVLLKCGDTFSLTESFKAGNNCIYAAYGSGSRPVLNFYKKLDGLFEAVEGVSNVWMADLSGLSICTGEAGKQNCNIGQIVVNGEVNWKRYVGATSDTFDPQILADAADGSWCADWNTSKLYFYSETDPNNLDICYAPNVKGIVVDGVSNLVIKGIEITGVGSHALNIVDSSNVTVKCCFFYCIGGSIQSSGSQRYGNAVQVWDSGNNIEIAYNYAAWIFDTCYTNQGSDAAAMQSNITFECNIGAHFFWGIETWGDGYSVNGFTNINYLNNILFDNIDVTNPDTPMYSNVNASLVDANGKRTDSTYVSYRTGYKYHQMSGIEVDNSGSGDVTNISGNIVWNSNRFLVWALNTRGEEHFSALKSNLLYAAVDNIPQACLLRYTNVDGTKEYCQDASYLDSSNVWSVHQTDENYDCGQEYNDLTAKLQNISGMN